MRKFARIVSVLFLATLINLLSLSVTAQTPAAVRPRLTAVVNEGQRRTLAGNTHPLARPEFDQGIAAADLPMERMLLVLARSPDQEAALATLLAQQQDRSSAHYHKWLTPAQFGQQFGAADEDIQIVSAWLQSNGFKVNRVSNGKSVIEFSGTAGQVQNAFHTEIHKYLVNGELHWANASDPEIPAALAPVVAGMATLHNFTKKSQLLSSGEHFEATDRSGLRPEFTSSTGLHAISPADFAKIYNLGAVYRAGIYGYGSTIAVVGRSNINFSDVKSFGNYFDLYFSTPTVLVNGSDHGDLGGGEEAEAVLDVSWSWAIAPWANIKLVVSQSTNTTDGVDFSEEYIIDNNLGDVMTESFSSCETGETQSSISLHLSLAQQAAAQGITYAVASGDSGAEGCDYQSEPSATGPLSVNVLASTPYTIAVGGTQFNENGNNAQYWNSANAGYGESAISYIPENVWNESCTSGGVNPCPTGYSPGLWAVGGGASALFPKPAWQTGVAGIPNDGARDVPDISFTAAEHDPYLICLAGSCTPGILGGARFYGVNGTSAATPAFAGVMALVVEKTHDRQGQAASVLYQLAAAEDLSACNASNTSALPASNCIFNDITAGNNVVPGEAGYGTNSGSYQAGSGYDLATGLGSLNVGNLVDSWPASDSGGTPALSISPNALVFGSVYLGFSSAPQQVTIKNAGTGTFFFATPHFSGYTPDFSITDNCGSALIAGQTCRVSVTFSPKFSGIRTGYLEFSYSNIYGAFTLTGTGVAASTAVISPSTLSFGSRKIVTRSAAQTITITNSTAAALNNSLITITGINAGDFVQVNNCGATLASAASCAVNVIFTPQLIGNRSASISISMNGGGAQQIIALSGTGVVTGFFEVANSLTGKVLDLANGSTSDGGLIEQNALNGLEEQRWQLLPALDGYHAIQNVMTGKVLDVTGGSTNGGTLIQQWDYLGNSNQQWQLVPVDDVHYKIMNRLTGKALDVTGGANANGIHIQQWDYVADAQQMWVLVPVTSYNITNSLSGEVLDVTGGSASDGTQIQQWPWNGNRQQQWQLMPVGNGYYAILNRMTGKVLDVTGESLSGGTPIQQWDYLGGANQQWQIAPVDTVHYKIVNRLSGLVLDDTNFSTSPGSLIQQWSYEGGRNQQWQFTPVMYYNIVNRGSGAVLDVTNGATSDGTLIQQWSSNGFQQQQWQLVPAGGGSCLEEAYCAIMNNLSGKVLDVTGSSTSNGTQIQQWDYLGGANQQWVLVPVPGGYYAIVNALSGKVLDVTAASTSNGTVIQQWQYLGGWNQQWQLAPVSN